MAWLLLTLVLSSGWSSGWNELPPWQTTAEMQQWLAARVPASGPAPWRLQRLHRALVSPDGLALRETGEGSATAVRVFERRRADCVGFSYLFAGLARSLGIPVYFVFAERVTTWKSGALRVDEAHLAVAWGAPDRPLVFDFSGIVSDATFQRIGDADAAAILASNRGARGLLAGRCAEALEWLGRAVRQGPTLASARDNLGVAQRICQR